MTELQKNKIRDLYLGSAAVQRTEGSPIRAIMDRAAAMRAAGHPVIAFSAGEPNFNTPEPIKQATIRAIQNNDTHYGSNRGTPALRACIARLTKKNTGVDYDPETEILVTCGGAEAINNALLAFVDPGDEVLLPSPAFVSYKNLIRMAGGTVVELPLQPENGFCPDPAAVERAITPRTTMLVLNNPNNPTGAVYPRATMEALAKIAVTHNLLVFCDEMYNALVYEGAEFVSAASLPGMKERTILVNGFSKTYAMTGWRLGYVTADHRLCDRILRVHQYSTTCAPTFIQHGLIDALELPETEKAVQEMIAAFAGRRRTMLAGLQAIPGIRCVVPHGAFYIMADVSGTGLSGMEFARRLLEEHFVATVPAIGLGAHCGKFVRISYAASDDAIAEGLARIRTFAESLTR
jgi:aspartate/methionine/tyrosine aminotransferase